MQQIPLKNSIEVIEHVHIEWIWPTTIQRPKQCPKINYEKVIGIKPILTSSFEIDSNRRTDEQMRNQSAAFIFNCYCAAVAYSLSQFYIVRFFSVLFHYAPQLHVSSRLHCWCILLFFSFIHSFIINFSPFVQWSGFSIHSCHSYHFLHSLCNCLFRFFHSLFFLPASSFSKRFFFILFYSVLFFDISRHLSIL